jgi:hypothetical protein
MLWFGKVLHPASEARCKELYPAVLAVVPLLSLIDVETGIGATCRVAPRRAEEATVSDSSFRLWKPLDRSFTPNE